MNIDPLAEQGGRWSPYAYAMDNLVYYVEPDDTWPNPFAKIESIVRYRIQKFTAAVDRAVYRTVSAVKSFLGVSGKSAGSSGSSVSASGMYGVQFWVDDESFKMDGLVIPDVAKDRSKVIDANATGVVAIVESMPWCRRF